MFKSLYYWFHYKFSKPDERGEYSSGYWPDIIRKETLSLCKKYSGRILEVGCGEGLFLEQLARQNPDSEIWGIDNNIKRLKQAEERIRCVGFKNVKLSFQEAEILGFKDGYFNTVVCINVFFNMPSFDSVRNALNQIARVCKNGGKLIFDFRNSLNLLLMFKYKLARYYDGTAKYLPLNTYNPKQIESVLKELNFSIVNIRFIGFFLKRLAPVIIIEARKNA